MDNVFECVIKLFMVIQIMEQDLTYVCLAIIPARCVQDFLSLVRSALLAIILCRHIVQILVPMGLLLIIKLAQMVSV